MMKGKEMKKRMKKRIIDYQINKEETAGWEICGQLSCDKCQLAKCPQGSIAF